MRIRVSGCLYVEMGQVQAFYCVLIKYIIKIGFSINSVISLSGARVLFLPKMMYRLIGDKIRLPLLCVIANHA